MRGERLRDRPQLQRQEVALEDQLHLRIQQQLLLDARAQGLLHDVEVGDALATRTSAVACASGGIMLCTTPAFASVQFTLMPAFGSERSRIWPIWNATSSSELMPRSGPSRHGRPGRAR